MCWEEIEGQTECVYVDYVKRREGKERMCVWTLRLFEGKSRLVKGRDRGWVCLFGLVITRLGKKRMCICV